MEPFRKPGEVDPKLIAELREMALAGHRVCDMARWLIGRLSMSLPDDRLISMYYFMNAFHLGISEVLNLGDGRRFPKPHGPRAWLSRTCVLASTRPERDG